MNVPPAPPGPATDMAPVEGFANCHVGIVDQFRRLDRLPALLEPARQARQIAGEAVDFFHRVVLEHHAEEERELFPAVLASARPGEERALVQDLVERLTREHRDVESAWKALEPGLRHVAKGQEGDLEAAALADLVARYLRHAHHEEEFFLPLSAQILGRNSNHMAALGISLHLRHAVTDLLSSGRFRI